MDEERGDKRWRLVLEMHSLGERRSWREGVDAVVVVVGSDGLVAADAAAADACDACDEVVRGSG